MGNKTHLLRQAEDNEKDWRCFVFVILRNEVFVILLLIWCTSILLWIILYSSSLSLIDGWMLALVNNISPYLGSNNQWNADMWINTFRRPMWIPQNYSDWRAMKSGILLVRLSIWIPFISHIHHRVVWHLQGRKRLLWQKLANFQV